MIESVIFTILFFPIIFVILKTVIIEIRDKLTKPELSKGLTYVDMLPLTTGILALTLLNSRKKIPSPEDIQKERSAKDSIKKNHIQKCVNIISAHIKNKCTTQGFNIELICPCNNTDEFSKLYKKYNHEIQQIFRDEGWDLKTENCKIHVKPLNEQLKAEIYR